MVGNCTFSISPESCETEIPDFSLNLHRKNNDLEKEKIANVYR